MRFTLPSGFSPLAIFTVLLYTALISAHDVVMKAGDNGVISTEFFPPRPHKIPVIQAESCAAGAARERVSAPRQPLPSALAPVTTVLSHKEFKSGLEQTISAIQKSINNVKDVGKNHPYVTTITIVTAVAGTVSLLYPRFVECLEEQKQEYRIVLEQIEREDLPLPTRWQATRVHASAWFNFDCDRHEGCTRSRGFAQDMVNTVTGWSVKIIKEIASKVTEYVKTAAVICIGSALIGLACFIGNAVFNNEKHEKQETIDAGEETEEEEKKQ